MERSSPQSRKAAKPPWNAQAAKLQSRKAAMETRKNAKPQSRKAARPQSRKAAKPQSCHGNAQAAKPQKPAEAASSATHAPLPAFIAAALPPPWIAEAESRKGRSRKAAKAAKPRSRKAAKPQSRKSRKAASSETQAPSLVFIAAVLPHYMLASS